MKRYIQKLYAAEKPLKLSDDYLIEVIYSDYMVNSIQGIIFQNLRGEWMEGTTENVGVIDPIIGPQNTKTDLDIIRKAIDFSVCLTQP